ncbi:MAG TPA: hypothetical protein VHW24_27040 [Bryobacteraceae bacterium]|nr:hypothetical protein [Bryobacteraceae bacterium]
MNSAGRTGGVGALGALPALMSGSQKVVGGPGQVEKTNSCAARERTNLLQGTAARVARG